MKTQLNRLDKIKMMTNLGLINNERLWVMGFEWWKIVEMEVMICDFKLNRARATKDENYLIISRNEGIP